MTDGSKRLILAGFYNAKKLYAKFRNWDSWDAARRREEVSKLGNEAEEMADHDEIEMQKDQIQLVDYPKTKQKYYMIYEVPHESIEPVYYWILGNLKYDLGFSVVHKITDIFTASEHSSFYGAAAQRLGLAQDRVMQYMATIGKMMKDLFQIVRELRWIDERRKYYEDAEKGLEGAEIALKGLWADMVDGVVGGQRTSSNIFVMAQQLQFAALPDLFFSTNVTKQILQKLGKEATEDNIRGLIDETVEKQCSGFNKEVRNLLKRKLYQFIVWKQQTQVEIIQRRKFQLDYLRQHYEVMQTYITWVRPYLSHIRRLGADISKLSSADLIAAFEGSMVEIEILAQQMPKSNDEISACILVTFNYRTRPQMQFSQEGGYHRGPLHQGETTIFWRAYSWDEKQIEAYKSMKREEDFALVATIDRSLTAAMEALGNDLKNYLEEAEKAHGKEEKKEKKEEKREGLLEPFVSIARGFEETFSKILPKKGKKTPAQLEAKRKAEEEAAAKVANAMCWQNYKLFKKSHKLLTW